jgi:sterol desaturase/sphingolipid hydroxylase (fatty acid hydroxylase superfamily)
VLEYEPVIRLGTFFGALVVMGGLESLFPRRERREQRLARWPANFAIVLINTLAVRLAFPTAVVGFALLMEERQVGLLNRIDLPFPVAVIAAMLVMDLAIYAQHIVFHRVSWLWRFHRMHHTDLDLDVTSGTRFHPVEILLSVFIKFGVIAMLGAPAVGVMLFAVLLNAGAMFNHANVRLPERLDWLLRLAIVTPDMHRVHHSIDRSETDSNFGFNLSIWDRLFRTYQAQPKLGHRAMKIGLPEYQDAKVQRIGNMLLQPWKGRT